MSVKKMDVPITSPAGDPPGGDDVLRAPPAPGGFNLFVSQKDAIGKKSSDDAYAITKSDQISLHFLLFLLNLFYERLLLS